MRGSRPCGSHLIAGLLLAGGVSLAAPYEGWEYRMPMTFERDTGVALTHFPVLVSLGEHLAGFAYSQFRSDDGRDLRFAVADNETELAYEIERWDTTGVSTVWLRMPELRGTGEVVNAYWGHGGVAAPAYTTNGAVWVNGYRGVWHLSETNILAGQTGGIHYDATTNAVDGSQLYNVSSNGVAGGGQYFNGSSAYINFGNPDPVKITSDLTLSVWVKPEVLTGERGLLSKWSGSWCWVLQNGVNQIWFDTWRAASVAISTDEWSQVAAVYDATAQEIRLYVNGQLRGTHAQTSAPGTTADLYLGHRGAGGPSLFQGWMDEARLAAAARSAAWMEASYLTVASNDWFTAYAEALPQATNLAVVARPASDIGDTYATLNGRVLHTGQAENPEVYFCWGSIDGLTNATTDWEHVIAMGTNWGAGDLFSTNISGLVSGSTYVYRAYVTNSTGEAWSEARTFTTASLPDVSNAGPAWVRRREARLEGELLDAGFQSPVVWVEYWPDGGAITSSVVIGTFNEQSFDVLLESLAPATEYHYRFGASNTAGVAWSAPDGFTTLTGDPIGWYVATNGLATTGNDWTNAFSTPAAALAVAEAGDTIYLAGQTFFLPATLAWTTSGVAFEGGYEGVGAPGDRDPGQWPTVVARDPMALPYRLLYVSGVTDGTLSGLVFSNGYAYSDTSPVRPEADGGGLYITDCTNLTIDQCVIRNNRAYHHVVNGGDIFGGGLYIVNSTVAILNSRIHANRVTTRSSTNIQNGNAGGLAIMGSGAVLVSNCTISANFVAADYLHGYARGGGAYVNGNATFIKTVFKDNDVGNPSRDDRQLGDGLAVMGGSALLENCLIAYNGTNTTAISGTRNMGVYAGGGATVMRNVTIVSNMQYGVFRAGGTVDIRDSIIWAHDTDVYETVAGGITMAYSSTQQGYNLGADGCVDDDPRFVDWTWFHLESLSGHYTGGYFDGGSWETGTVYSALIDAGNPASAFGREPSPGGARVNMGAYGNTDVASKSPPLTVTNRPASGISPTGATLNGELLLMGDPEVDIRFYWGTSNGGTDPMAWGANASVGRLYAAGTFSLTVGGLAIGQQHWFAAFASNSAGSTAWAQPSQTFVPQVSAPEIINTGVENDDTALVTLGGEVTSTGGENPFVYVCWGTTEGNTIDTNTWENVAAIGPQAGAFTHQVAVTLGSNYFYTLYAVNAGGNAWGRPPLPFGLYRDRYVDIAAAGSGTGYSWSNAFTSIQAALDDTTDSRTNRIYVRGGTYGLVYALTWTGAHVRVYGGYEGVGMPGTRDSGQWPTIVSNPAGVIRLLAINGARDALLDGVTLTKGNMPGTGGGLLIASSEDVAIRDCRLTDNVAIGNGGGIAVVQSTNVWISGCRVDGNRATDAGGVRYGGGLYIEGGSGTISNTVVEWNRAQNGDLNYGAGIYFNGGAWTVRDSHIRYNTCSGATPRGGGVVLTGSGNYTFFNCVIAQNHSTGYDGIWQINGTALFENCSIIGNNGQGVVGTSGTTIRNSILWKNTVDIVGAVNLFHNNLETGVSEGINGNISAHPLFERGLYLAAGSPCRGAGDRSAAAAGLTGYTTRADGTPVDPGELVDLGYHAPAGIDPATADLHVAPAGDDGNSGVDWGNALASITRATALAVEGTRIHLAEGVYDIATETFPLQVNRIGLHLLAAAAAETVIDAAGSDQRAVNLVDTSFGLVSNVTVRNGGRPSAPTGNGAGLYIWNANELVIADAVISNNISGHHGGGISIWHSHDLDIRSCVIQGNILDVENRDTIRIGGGLYAFASSGTILDSIVHDNRTRNTRHGSGNHRTRGGGLGFEGGAWQVESTAIETNQVLRFSSDYIALLGGGVYIVSGTHEFRSCLFARNRVVSHRGEHGSGLYLQSGTLTLMNCTFADNIGVFHPGEALRRQSGTLAMTNTIVWGHDIDYVNPDLDGDGHDPNIAWSNFESGLNEGFQNGVSVDPLFVNREAHDYRLMNHFGFLNLGPTSPCVDAGLNLPWMLGARDLDGNNRIMRGYWDGQPIVDLGAYESVSPKGTLLQVR